MAEKRYFCDYCSGIHTARGEHPSENAYVQIGRDVMDAHERTWPPPGRWRICDSCFGELDLHPPEDVDVPDTAEEWCDYCGAYREPGDRWLVGGLHDGAPEPEGLIEWWRSLWMAPVDIMEVRIKRTFPSNAQDPTATACETCAWSLAPGKERAW